MGMSSHVYGVAPPDEKWQKMKAAYDACTSAGVEVPTDIMKFFNWERPDEHGVVISLERHESVAKWNAEMEDGFVIELAKIPKHVKYIRFVNSY